LVEAEMHLDSHPIADDQKQDSRPDFHPAVENSSNRFLHQLRRGQIHFPRSLEVTLFGLAIGIYLLTHLIGLTRFPIYFFSDEAIQTVAASNLVRDNFRDEEGALLPTYFKNGTYYNLSTSVYAQVLPYILFGKSVFITRATSVLISLLAALSISLMLRDIYQVPYWWTGVLLLSIAPAWFLHSRTAFETVFFVSFYACFLYAYSLYRYRSPHYLYYSILLGGLAFYSYSPGQVVIVLTGFLFLISDAGYHWRNRRILLRGAIMLLVLALPYLRFWSDHPGTTLEHLRTLDSYWMQSIPLNEKLARFGSEYLFGLNPGYWFIPNQRDLARHLMKGYGHLLLVFLPFLALGLFLAIRNIRHSAYRHLLIVLLVVPVGGAIVAIGITRVLAFVIPAVLFIALGINQTMTWLESRHLPRKALAASLFVALSLSSFFMLRDVLNNAATWYEDYGLGGMQYGAQQLYTKLATYLNETPQTEIILSPNWANGADVVARFFLGDPLPIQIGSVDSHISHLKPLDWDTLFVMTSDEYQMAQESGKFKDFEVEETLRYPNGAPGFYFVRLSYVDQIEQIMEKEQQERMALRSEKILIDGELVEVRYSLLDMGEIEHIFDRDPHTLGRTFEANPAIIELLYPTARTIHGVSVIIGSTEAEISAMLYPDPNSEPVEFIKTFQGTVEQPEAVFDFTSPTRTQKIRLEIRDLHQSEPGNVHMWEITTH
jgi:4-amino-4-deoxy-L-arabinose transferase-like glycosyltransferase